MTPATFMAFRSCATSFIEGSLSRVWGQGKSNGRVGCGATRRLELLSHGVELLDSGDAAVQDAPRLRREREVEVEDADVLRDHLPDPRFEDRALIGLQSDLHPRARDDRESILRPVAEGELPGRLADMHVLVGQT